MDSNQNVRLKHATKAFIALECVLIIFLGVRFYKHYNDRLLVSTVPLSRGNLSFPAENLAYFIEPLQRTADQNADQSPLPEWLPSIPRYSINADTLNDRFNYSPTKSDTIYRIVTLGDSFTYGVFVDTPDNWTEILEDDLNKNLVCPPYQKFEVINLGYLTYDTLYEVERFKRRGEKYNPDLVIWFLVDNDFDVTREWVSARVDSYRRKLLQATALITETDEGNFWKQSRQDFLETFGTGDLARYHTQILRSLDTYFKGNLLVYALRYAWESPLVTVVDNQAIVENFAKTRPNTHFYVSDHDLIKGDQTFPDGHPNTEGHAFIAKDILKYLRENGILGCTETQV